MERLQYLFHELDSEESMLCLAAVLDASGNRNAIHIDQGESKGLIRKIKLEDGMRLWASDFRLPKTLL